MHLRFKDRLIIIGNVVHELSCDMNGSFDTDEESAGEKFVEKVCEQVLQGFGVAECVAFAVAVAATGIDVELRGNIVSHERLIVADAVVGVNGAVVLTSENESRGSLGVHLHVVAVEGFHFRRGGFAYQPNACSHVGDSCVH